MRLHISGTHDAFSQRKMLVGTWYKNLYRHSFPVPPFAKGFSCECPSGDHKSYFFFSHISSNWHFLACHKPPLSQRSTARERNPQGISKLVNKGWLLLVWRQLLDNFSGALCTWSRSSWFLALWSIWLCGPSSLQNLLQWVPQRILAIWHASQSQSQGTSYLQLAVVPNCLKAQWVWCTWVGADRSMSISCGHLNLWGSWGVLLMTRHQNGVCLQRRLIVLFAGLLK